MEVTLKGMGVSPGVAIGPAVLFNLEWFAIPKYEVFNPGPELARLDIALEATRGDLTELYERTSTELGQAHADIFNVHLMLLDDVVMREELAEMLREEKCNVEYLLRKLTRKYAQSLKSARDSIFRERTADLLDVADRILRHLLNAGREDLNALGHPSIVVAHDLSPSDTANIDKENTLGLITDSGSVTSHTAILARALEIPAVMGLAQVSQYIENGVIVAINGSDGVVVIRPSEDTIQRFEEEGARFAKERDQLRNAVQEGPCQTRDGIEIPLQANIELPLEIASGLRAGAQGVGLYRTEYLFLNRDSLPEEQEQFEAYTEVVQAMEPHPVTLRTIDLGGDKFASHLNFSRDENPQLGWRAVRFCLACPDIFKVQLRAILRASAMGKIQIMFPMISGVEEFRQVRAVLDSVKQDLDREGIAYDRDIRIGSMIEVPSAVALANVLALECDFFSIGTNDLIQYSLAVDRVNEKIAHLYEPAHPAVLRMIGWTAKAAREAGIPCGMCGEMAGDPAYTKLLLGLGITSLSMSAISLPAIRAGIAAVDLEEARALAREVLNMATAQEVKAALGIPHENSQIQIPPPRC